MPASWLVVVAIADIGWVFVWRYTPGWAVACSSCVLLFLVAAVAGYRASVTEQLAPPLDVRLLPPDKHDAVAQWRGVVSEWPRHFASTRGPGRVTAIVEIHAWRSGENSGAWQSATGRVELRIYDLSAGALRYGDALEWSGGLRRPSAPGNPGGINRPRLLASRGIAYECLTDRQRFRVVARDEGSPWMAAASLTRPWALRVLRLGMTDDPVASSLVAGMLLGDTSSIPESLDTAFRATGTYHIFAVSGQNVGVLAAVGVVALGAFGLMRWRWGILVIPLLVFYCLLTGNQPSAVRALLMALLVLMAWRMERPTNVLNLWSMAALIVLVWEPALLLSLGFQFSFAVVLALILFSPPLYALLYRPFAPDPFLPWSLAGFRRRSWDAVARWATALMAVSLAAWMGSLPFSYWYFHRFGWIDPWANLVVVPLASLVVVIGTLSALTWFLTPVLTLWLNNANWLIIHTMVAAVQTFASVPGGSMAVASPKVEWAPPVPEFICLDSGPVPLGIIRFGERAWLINPGSGIAYRWNVDPARRYFGINWFEAIIVTEISATTAGAANRVIEQGLTNRWITPPSYVTARVRGPWLDALRAQPHRETWHAGDIYELAPGFRVEVLGPVNIEASRVRDRGLVLLFSYGDHRLLWAGRAGSEALAAIMEGPLALRVDVLVQAVGKETAAHLANWLDRVRPVDVIVPRDVLRCGEAAARVEVAAPRDAMPHVWSVMETGAVTVRLGPEGIVLEGWRENIAD